MEPTYRSHPIECVHVCGCADEKRVGGCMKYLHMSACVNVCAVYRGECGSACVVTMRA